MATSTKTKPAADLVYLCRALKAPTLARSVERLGERARADGWSHEEFLTACLEREVAARQSNGGEIRIRAARFPARKTLEDFDFDHQRSLRRDVVAHLGALDFVEGRDNVVFLGPPGTGKTHLAIGLSIRACQAGHRVAFATAAQWVDRLAEAHGSGRLHAELTRLGRYPLVNGQVVVPAGGQQKSPPLGRDQTFFGPGRPPFERASFIRNDSPSVTTTTAWWSRRSRRLTAVVCSGRKRPQSSKGQCEPMPRDRRS